MNVNLSGEVAAGVDLVIHVERGVLRIAEVVFGVGLIDAVAQFFFVVAAGPDMLALFAVNNCRAGVLTEGKLAFGRYFGVAEHGEGYIFVVGRCFGVAENLGDHFVVFAAKHECVVVSGLTGKNRERFGVNDQHFVAVPVFNFYVVGSQVIVFRRVGAERKHFLIFERFGHVLLELVVYWNFRSYSRLKIAMRGCGHCV